MKKPYELKALNFESPKNPDNAKNLGLHDALPIFVLYCCFTLFESEFSEMYI